MRSDSQTLGEGQALALREWEAFFHRIADACHRDVEQFMKHPHFNNFRHITSNANVAFVLVLSMRDFVWKMVWMACWRRKRE